MTTTIIDPNRTSTGFFDRAKHAVGNMATRAAGLEVGHPDPFIGPEFGAATPIVTGTGNFGGDGTHPGPLPTPVAEGQVPQPTVAEAAPPAPATPEPQHDAA